MSMAGGYFKPKGRKYFRVWYPWKGEKIFINHYLDHSKIFHEGQAQRVLEKIRADVDAGIFDPSSWGKDRALLFENAWNTYQLQSKVGKAREEQREMIFGKYLLPYFKHKSIRDILTINIQTWDAEISQQNHSEGYFRLIRVTFKAFLHFFRDSLIKMPRFPVSRISPKEIQWLEKDQQMMVHEFIPDLYKSIFKFMMITGCRPSEVCNLRKQDIDWNKKIFTFRSTKTRSITSLPITSEIEETFKSPKVIENLEFVFCTKRGQRYRRQILYQIWNSANQKANGKYGIPVVSNYAGNRHSFACQKANEGYQMELISKVLGHSSTRTTEKYYVRYKTEKLKPLLSSVAQSGHNES
jgi:integrase/recombinase XerD